MVKLVIVRVYLYIVNRFFNALSTVISIRWMPKFMYIILAHNDQREQKIVAKAERKASVTYLPVLMSTLAATKVASILIPDQWQHFTNFSFHIHYWMLWFNLIQNSPAAKSVRSPRKLLWKRCKSKKWLWW